MLGNNTQKYQKGSFFLRFLVFCVIVFSTRASDLANSPIALLSICLFIVIYSYLIGNKFSSVFFNLIIILLLYFTLLFLKFKEFTPLFYARILAIFVLGYAVVFFTKEKFILIYGKIVSFLALVSLPFFILGIYSHPLLYRIGANLSEALFLDSQLSTQIDYRHFLIFTVRPIEEKFRNSGFMWEPGGFSVVCCIALYFNLFKSGFKINRWSIILIISILTTQSTTGYLLLLVVGLFYLINRKARISIYFFPVFILVGFYFWQLDFMGDKIIDLSSEADEKLEVFYESKSHTGTQSLGRFAGLIYNLEGVKLSPIFGIGSHEDILYSRNQVYLYSTNGVGHFLMTFGYLGLFIFLFYLYKSSVRLSKYYNYKGGWTFFIILLISGFSFPFFMTPIFCSFIFLSSTLKK